MSSEKQQFTIKDVSDANNLVNSFNRTKKGTTWKASVQKFEIDLLKNINDLQTRIENNTYKAYPFIEFPLNDRGANRWIKSMHISDRVVQRTLCDYVLLPELSRYLIYDNGASMKNKGLDFALDRLYKHLNDFFVQNHTNEGYIVLVDFTKYFDNIEHDEAYDGLTRDIDDRQLKDLISYLISLFEVDLSMLPAEMREKYIKSVFNNIEFNRYLYTHHLRQNPNAKDKMEKGAGVGSQISQIIGVYHPHRIDNYFKIVKGIHGYGRYQDDTYIIVRTLEEAKECLSDMERLCAQEGIYINKKKTQIVKLSSSFTFLKVKHRLTKKGKIIRNACHKNITRQRRKMKTLNKSIIEKNEPFSIVSESFISCAGRLKKLNNQRTLNNMTELYFSLYMDYTLREEND